MAGGNGTPSNQDDCVTLAQFKSQLEEKQEKLPQDLQQLMGNVNQQ